MKDLVGKTAFVTGAASGIGFGIATALAQAGSNVMLCDLRREPLENAVAALREMNADVHGVAADVSLKAELQAAAEATIARFGKIHVLVNNAGVGGGGWTDNSWNWVLGVNLMSVIWGIEIFSPLIVAHGEGGHIVCTSSISGLVAGAGSPLYDVSKYGVVALCEGMRNTLASHGIGVSVLCPGYIRTNFATSGMSYVPERIAKASVPPRPEVAALGLVPARTSGSAATTATRVDGGIDPLYVGELVREGIENDWLYLFTDTEFESAVDARFAAIKQGFDRIRGRSTGR